MKLVARFRHGDKDGEGGRHYHERHDIVRWDGLEAFILDAGSHLRSAASYGNFAGFELEEESTVIPSQLGWWLVFELADGDLYSEPVIAWRVGESGWQVEAITPYSGDNGPLEVAEDSKQQRRAFVYKPEGMPEHGDVLWRSEVRS